jgi:lipid-A-disaccharide synthase
MRIFISTGEVSGDVVASRIAAELQSRDEGIEIFGLGGSRMEAAGVRIDFATNHLGIVGVSESFSAIPSFLRALIRIRRIVRQERPDAAILIGNDIFNVVLGRWLRARGIPTIAYFPPQVWIWRSLAWLFTRSYDAILTSFPEEQTVYELHCQSTTYVGHYLCDTLTSATSEERMASRSRVGLDAGQRVIGLFPGSRKHEVRSLTPILLDAARQLSEERPNLRFLLPLCEPSFDSFVRKEIARRRLENVVSICSDSHDVMRCAELLLLASGTATLEATLIGTPMVVAYRVSPLTLGIVRFCIRRGLIASETLALPNLVAGRRIVPELSQETLSAPELVRRAREILEDSGEADTMRRELAGVRHELARSGTIRRVADLVMERARAGRGAERTATAASIRSLAPLSTESE